MDGGGHEPAGDRQRRGSGVHLDRAGSERISPDGITTNGDATVMTNAPVGILKSPEGYKEPTLPKDEFVIFEEYDTA